MNFKDKTVIITGGSSGIGLEIAREFLRLGARLHLLARDAERLETARQSLHASVRTHAVDVSDPLAINATIRAIGDEGGIVALICNAGIMRVGRVDELTVDDFEAALRTNYFGTLYPILAAWPYLKNAGASRIGLVSSVAGYTGVYGYTAYAPTKFAITGLAECLRMEGASDGIRVTVIFPPDTETPMLEYERAHAPARTRAITSGARVLPAAVVARKFVAGIVPGDFEIYCNAESRLLRLFKALLPAAYYRLLDRK
jgi:3-dehydrosphinganine reductase